ncbi:MAG: hypothetical protein HY329_24270 [Chloroflexi bacterium]|nr:hypothetical protein [Chloroflexota bacterium]
MSRLIGERYARFDPPARRVVCWPHGHLHAQRVEGESFLLVGERGEIVGDRLTPLLNGPNVVARLLPRIAAREDALSFRYQLFPLRVERGELFMDERGNGARDLGELVDEIALLAHHLGERLLERAQVGRGRIVSLEPVELSRDELRLGEERLDPAPDCLIQDVRHDGVLDAIIMVPRPKVAAVAASLAALRPRVNDL